MNPHTDGRSEAGALVPLSKLQIRSLILLARQAYAARTMAAVPAPAGDDCPFDVPTEAVEAPPFDQWRRQQCLIAVERPGFSCCRNEDYLPLKAHFLQILGRGDEADEARARSALDARARALHEFQRACAEAASAVQNPEAYADGFLRKVCNCGIRDASDKQIWRAVYLLRRKAAQMAKRGRHIKQEAS